MVAAAICRRLRPNKHRRLLPTSSLQFSSSSSDDGNESSSSSSSYFNDVKASLKQTSPPQSPSLFGPNPLTPKAHSLTEIRKNLSDFRRSSVKPPASDSSPPSLKSLVLLLKSHVTSPLQSQKPEFPGRRLGLDELKRELVIVRRYSYGELGERLRNLRPEGKKIGFSLVELNERLRKLRELEEKENQLRTGVDIHGLRESLYSLKISLQEQKAKANANADAAGTDRSADKGKGKA